MTRRESHEDSCPCTVSNSVHRLSWVAVLTRRGLPALGKATESRGAGKIIANRLARNAAHRLSTSGTPTESLPLLLLRSRSWMTRGSL